LRVDKQPISQRMHGLGLSSEYVLPVSLLPHLPQTQVGAFPHYGGRWAEWNGGFRDTVRQFLKGTEGPWAGNFASALCGSPNLYANTHPAETDW
jgi:hypothetical protein